MFSHRRPRSGLVMQNEFRLLRSVIATAIVTIWPLDPESARAIPGSFSGHDDEEVQSHSWIAVGGPIKLSRPIKSVSSGDDHTVALLDNGTVVAWGMNQFGQCDVPDGLEGVTMIAAGEHFSAALLKDGRIITWGRIPADVFRCCSRMAGCERYHNVLQETLY